MKFGPVPVAQAGGAVLAHSLDLKGKRLRKGRVLSDKDIDMIAAAGHKNVTVAQLDPQDVDENTAAQRIAEALVPDPEHSNLRLSKPGTGRVNIYAQTPGVLGLDVAQLEAANRIDPMITIATLPPFARTDLNAMVATVKIIAYGVARAKVEQAAQRAQAAMRLHAVTCKTATLIQSDIGTGPGKGQGAIATRLEALDMVLEQTVTVPHQIDPLASAISAATSDIILILTASATSDTFDVAPEALRHAGGTVERFGMPVDPGNLLFLGQYMGRPVIGLPGCARSPALNGADWVLERVACGLTVTEDDIAAMGIGGLLKESPARPHPREQK